MRSPARRRNLSDAGRPTASHFGNGYTLRSLQSVDSVSGPVQGVLRSVFLFAGLGALLAAAALSVFSVALHRSARLRAVVSQPSGRRTDRNFAQLPIQARDASRKFAN